MKKDIYRLLTESFDRTLSNDEQAMLNEALRSDKVLLADKQRLERVRNLLAAEEYDFAPFFETRVLAGIETVRELFSEQLFYTFRRFAFISVIIIAAFVGWTYFHYGSLDLNSMSGLSALNHDSAETFLLYGWEK